MAVSDQLAVLRKSIFYQKEIAMLLIGIVLIFIALLIPLHPTVMDLFLAINITVSVVILMAVIFLMSPLELSSFPSILLAVTLYRLTLNIATTRLILSDTDEDRAGMLILQFGSFITGSGDKVISVIIGLVIFLIIVIVQFVVITKGSGRVAEVSARFTLDSMPGKQMAIDADLNAGLIDEAEARKRREELSSQADFYGAMDGAAKFVRGDAIAGLIITGINLIGGLVVGMAYFDKAFPVALTEYTRLTIGDGLVSQIPALIVSFASGLIITKGDSRENLGSEVVGQLFTRKPALFGAGVLLILMGFIPHLWFMMLFGVALMYYAYVMKEGDPQAVKGSEGATYTSSTGAQQSGGAAPAGGAAAAGKEGAGGPEDVSSLLKLDQLELEVGYSLIPLVDASQGGDLLERITMMRRQLALEMGLLVKPIRVRDNMQLSPNDYSIKLRDAEIAHGMALPDQFLAMDSGVVTEKVEGIETVEPAFGLPAVWIPESLRETASLNGYTVVDATTVISTHITEIIKIHAADILSRQTVSEILEKQKELTPAIVDEVQDRLRLSEIQAVMKNLLREKVSIRNLETILETLGDYAERIKDPEILTEYVRARLGRSICAPLVDENMNLFCVTLEPALEESVQKAIHTTEGGSYLGVDPDFLQRFVAGCTAQLEKLVSSGHHPVILTTGQVRYHVSNSIRATMPNVSVLSYNEIVTNIKVESVGVISLNGAGG